MSGKELFGVGSQAQCSEPNGTASFWEAEMEATAPREASHGQGLGVPGTGPALPQKRQGSTTEPLWVAFLTSDFL